MLRRNLMPTAHDAALEKRESGLDGIGVNVSVHVTPRTVIDGLVILDARFPHGDRICRGIIGEHDFYVFADVLADELRQCARLRIFGVEEAEIAVALTDAHHHILVVPTSGLPSIAIFAANVSHIHFDLPIQHRHVGLGHRVTDAVTEVPCGFVTHTDCALNLASRHALLRFAEQMGCEEPFREGQVRIVEYRARSNGELIVTVLAVEETLFGFEFHRWPIAAQAARAFRPAQANQEFLALVFGREKGVYIN